MLCWCSMRFIVPSWNPILKQRPFFKTCTVLVPTPLCRRKIMSQFPEYGHGGLMPRCKNPANGCFGVVVRVILHLHACIRYRKGSLYTLFKYSSLGGGWMCKISWECSIKLDRSGSRFYCDKETAFGRLILQYACACHSRSWLSCFFNWNKSGSLVDEVKTVLTLPSTWAVSEVFSVFSLWSAGSYLSY